MHSLHAGGYKIVIENPYSAQHYLTRYFPIKPKLIDDNRWMRGDYCKKPTQFWFINCEPKNNLIFEAIPRNGLGTKDTIKRMKKTDYETMGTKSRKVGRSMIHPDYANRFIREFILDGDGNEPV